MARAGDELVNPVTGLRTVFRKTARETGGELLQVDWIGEPDGPRAPTTSIHARRSIRGHLRQAGTAGGRHRAHPWRRGGDRGRGGLRARSLEREQRRRSTRPGRFQAGLRTEIAFETLAGLARDGKTNKAGAPRNPLLLALVLHHFEEEIYFVRPPLAVQRMIFGALAKVARLLGYRAEYPYARRSEISRAGM